MAHRIELIYTVPDTRARVRKKKLHSLGYSSITSVTLIDVYTVDKTLTPEQLKTIASMLSNPVNQAFSINAPTLQKNFTFAIETGFLPGVTDNVGNTAKEAIEDLLKSKFKNSETVYSSQVTLVDGTTTEEDARKIGESLVNPLIQRIHIKNFARYKKEKGMDTIVPKVHLKNDSAVITVNLNVDDTELQKIGKEGVQNGDGTRNGPLALDLTYMKAVQNYFKNLGRNPTDVELESIAQTWSEHCKHTIFADPIDELPQGLYKTYIKSATFEVRKRKREKDFCVSVFTDNSGAIEFDDTYLVTHKAETHNSPSALDPFGGAITGIVGVNRDAIGFGLGAKPVINTYGYCFGYPDDETPYYKAPNFSQKMLPPRRIMNGVIDGVNSGGNCSGIPTPQGFVFFDKRFQAKPLVFVGTVGLIPKKINGKPSSIKKAQAGDYIVMIGGRVGKDGIHGATFSSEALDTGSPATAVQIGDPITQKKLSDAVVKEAREKGLFHSITDNGAGGLSCSVAEMAKECGGFVAQLEDIPLKYPGLKPWEIWISESQERMTLAVPKKSWKAFAELMKKRSVEATIIGEFTDSGKCVVKYHGKTVMNMDMDFLHNGLPPRPMQTTYSYRYHPEPVNSNNYDTTFLMLQILSRYNISSFEFISTQYDHEVQAGSIIKPLQGKGRVNGDATVVKPVLGSSKGVAISQGIYPTYSDIDTYHMAAASIDTAIRNLVVVGANPDRIALLDNFCWCSSNDPQRLRELKRAVQACYEYALAYKTPFISGKDSMFNDFSGFDENGKPVKISIPPTLLVSSISVMDDAAKAVSMDFKFAGDLIYVLGETHEELGGSEFFAMLGEMQYGKQYTGKHVPRVNTDKNRKLYNALHQCIDREIISSAISINRGGLSVALMKSAMAGMMGFDVSLKNISGTAMQTLPLLFSESPGRFIVSIAPKNRERFEPAIEGNAYSLIGIVNDDNEIRIRDGSNKTMVKTDVAEALEKYKMTFREY